jgi:phospholipid/cholesterol/gamma-HCH transport system substrate-binding protein
MVEDSRQPLTDAITRLERIMAKIDEGEGTLGRLVNNPALYDEITGVSAKLNLTLGKLMNDPSLYDNLNHTMINLVELSNQINSGQGTLGKLLADDRLYEEATETMSNLNNISGKINQGKGTLGKLVHDDALYVNVSDSMARINSIAAKIDDGEGYRDAKTTLHKVEKSVDGLSDTGPLSALGVVLGTLF